MDEEGSGWKPLRVDPPANFTPIELDRHEQAILYLLCKEGRYHSSVSLAADLFETTEEVQESRVLEWNLVELLLADMSEKGLVTYRLGKFHFGVTGAEVKGSEVIVHIRATRKGYEVAKVEFKWQHLPGEHWTRHDQPLREGDKTDFRSHGETAVGIGPITHEDLIEHCIECDHINKHRAQLRELYGTDEV